MSSASFIKNNLSLVAGIALPLVLAGLFFAFSVLPRSLTPPPKYDVLFSVNGESADAGEIIVTRWYVRDGKVLADTRRHDGKNYAQRKNLIRFSAGSGKTSEILPVPRDTGKGLLLSEVAGLRVDDDETAPDGYRIKYPEGYSRGLVTDIMIGGHRASGFRIVKSLAAYPVRTERYGAYYYGSDFIGWVVE